jgi:probable addiction module antidote protein
VPKRTESYDKWLYGKLTNPRIAANYLNAASDDSTEMLLIAMRDIAEAHKMSRVASGAEVSRESLYRTLSKKGNPKFETFANILDVFGLKISVIPKNRAATGRRNRRKSPSAKVVRSFAAAARRK